MSEEIKEILNNIKNVLNEDNGVYDVEIEKELLKQLLNYITNLQKENQSLKNNYNDNEQAIHKIMKENEELKDTIKKDNHLLGCNFSKKDKYKQERDIYKQRNEKAVEYIKRKKLITTEVTNGNIIYLLNILQGGDE